MGLTSSLPQPKRQPGGFMRPAVLWTLLALIPVVAVVAFAVLQPVKVRPRMGLAPGYLFDQMTGERLTNEDMRGRLVFYDFTYTTCGDACPPTGASMRAIQQLVTQVDTAGLPVEFVTVAFDPERDTPVALQAYASSLNADLANWHFVTGDPARLKNVIGGGFGIYYQPDDGGGYTYDPAIVLVDGNGIIRAEYKGGTPDPAEVTRDLDLLVTEIRNSDGPGSLVYEAAHLFLCYPKS